MLSDYQLRNFEKYLSNCPKHYLGVQRRSLGAYDGVEGAAAHGFRRGIRIRDFGRGGAFDSASGPGDALSHPGLCFLARKLSAADWAQLQGVLAGSAPDDDETNAGDAELTSLSDHPDDGVSGAMDSKRRTALALDAQQQRAARESFSKMFPDAASPRHVGGSDVRALF